MPVKGPVLGAATAVPAAVEVLDGAPASRSVVRGEVHRREHTSGDEQHDRRHRADHDTGAPARRPSDGRRRWHRRRQNGSAELCWRVRYPAATGRPRLGVRGVGPDRNARTADQRRWLRGCGGVEPTRGLGDGKARRGGHLHRARITIGGLFGQTRGDHLIHRRRNRVAFLRRPRRRSDHVAHRNLLERLPRKRRMTGQTLIEHTRQRIDIRTRRSLPRLETLRRHIGPRADRRTGRRQRSLTDRARDAEVDEIREVVVRQQNIGRLHVAVHQTRPMSRVQRRGDLLDDVHRAIGLQRPTIQQRLQIHPVDQPHRHIQPPVDLPDVVDGHHVRIVQAAPPRGPHDGTVARTRDPAHSAATASSTRPPDRWPCHGHATPHPSRHDPATQSAGTGQKACPPPAHDKPADRSSCGDEESTFPTVCPLAVFTSRLDWRLATTTPPMRMS